MSENVLLKPSPGGEYPATLLPYEGSLLLLSHRESGDSIDNVLQLPLKVYVVEEFAKRKTLPAVYLFLVIVFISGEKLF